MRYKIKNKIIFASGLTGLLFLVVMSSYHTIYHYRHGLREPKEKAWLLTQTILKAIESPMLEGEMQRVEEMLIAVGKLPQLKRVHITDREGIIKYSCSLSRVDTPTGSEIIKKALKLKKQVAGFEHRDGDCIYSLAIPIANEKNCHPCHGKKNNMLGVLRVGIDWIPFRENIMRLFRTDIITALILIIVVLIISFLFQRLYNNAQDAYKNLKQAQEQLVKTEKMAAIGQMAAAISHDLRNPLTGIKMAVYYLGSKLNKEQREFHNIIKDIELEIDYASNVVTNILTYSRPMELIYTHTDINKLIEETLPIVHLQSRELNIELVKSFDKKIPSILIDSKQMKQVIVNVISNAIQAMPKGGKLDINTKLTDDGFVEIIVQDTGVGIAKEDIQKIFMPFFTTKARGVGLGLSIVNSIVEKHAGKVQLKSELGLGTNCIIKLPIREDLKKSKGT